MAQAIMDKFTKNVFKEKSIIDPNKKLRAAVVGIGRGSGFLIPAL